MSHAKESKSQSKSRPQRRRFIETAKELEADETGEAFEKAFGKLVPAKRKQLSGEETGNSDTRKK